MTEEPKGYLLAHLYRHPEDKDAGWNLSMTHVSGRPGTDVYPGLMYTHFTRLFPGPK